MIRLFFGVALPQPAHDRAAAAAADLRSGIERAAPRARVRWAEPANLHLTLWFIGNVDERRAEAIVDAFGAPLTTPQFALQLGGAGVFPPSGPLRTIWLGLSRGGDAMSALHDEVARRLVPLGFEAERRPYSAHLTIGRVKDVSPPGGRRIREIVRSARFESDVCRIDALTLFRSRLSPAGSRYEVLLRVPLRVET